MPSRTDSEAAHKFGFTPGQVVQEFYYDEDVDMALRESIERVTGEELADEDFAETTDAAIIWWRSDDGDADDLTDLLTDAAANLDDGGDIWVLSPKAGRPGQVQAADVEDAATNAGMHASASVDGAKDWLAMRLVVRARGV
ncbi:hypothetical protein BSZ39_12410 [Bowdeniella nasicola]|uniref:DUF3052 domain-containing protein n=1 Tax=Bowdeniella nasicola TaxID=208480 RepID=A0A1Q5PZ46_9ACTO|nr:hypothetical protein BSZ39_12410 [Bowdeniella nasicola]